MSLFRGVCMKRKIAVFSLVLVLLSTTSTFALKWDHNPPGGILPAEAPMFVCFGWDDNAFPDGVNWFVDFMKDMKNSDGSAVRTTLFSTSGYASGEKQLEGITPESVQASWKNAYAQGHEIANHTQLHTSGSSGKDSAYWHDAINNCNKFFKEKLGIPSNEIYGFRTPFLEYGDGTFKALKGLGFRYDCSIEIGFNWYEITPGFQGTSGWVSALAFEPGKSHSGKKHWWPYTLENGPATGSSAKSQVKMDGIWEFPVQVLQQMPSGTDPLNIPNDLSVKTITGFDYNTWKLMTTKEEYLDLLKSTFHQRYNGNRSPMLVNVHSDYYSEFNTTVNSQSSPDYFKVNYKDRRWAMEEFVKYVKALPDVRIVPFITALRWIEKPVKASAYKAVDLKGTTGIISQEIKTSALTPVAIKLTSKELVLNMPISGSASVRLVSASGKIMGELYNGMVPAGEKVISLSGNNLSSGVYFVQVNGSFSSTSKVIVE